MSKKLMTLLAVGALVVAVGAGCGFETMEVDACTLEGGTFSEEVVDAGGSCPYYEVEQMEHEREIELDEDVYCEDDYRSSHTQTVEAEDGTECTVSGTQTGRVTEDGFEDMMLDLEIECGGEPYCEHEFDVIYERQ